MKSLPRLLALVLCTWLLAGAVPRAYAGGVSPEDELSQEMDRILSLAETAIPQLTAEDFASPVTLPPVGEDAPEEPPALIIPVDEDSGEGTVASSAETRKVEVQAASVEELKARMSALVAELKTVRAARIRENRDVTARQQTYLPTALAAFEKLLAMAQEAITASDPKTAIACRMLADRTVRAYLPVIGPEKANIMETRIMELANQLPAGGGMPEGGCPTTGERTRRHRQALYQCASGDGPGGMRDQQEIQRRTEQIRQEIGLQFIVEQPPFSYQEILHTLLEKKAWSEDEIQLCQIKLNRTPEGQAMDPALGEAIQNEYKNQKAIDALAYRFVCQECLYEALVDNRRRFEESSVNDDDPDDPGAVQAETAKILGYRDTLGFIPEFTLVVKMKQESAGLEPGSAAATVMHDAAWSVMDRVTDFYLHNPPWSLPYGSFRTLITRNLDAAEMVPDNIAYWTMAAYYLWSSYEDCGAEVGLRAADIYAKAVAHNPTNVELWTEYGTFLFTLLSNKGKGLPLMEYGPLGERHLLPAEIKPSLWGEIVQKSREVYDEAIRLAREAYEAAILQARQDQPDRDPARNFVVIEKRDALTEALWRKSRIYDAAKDWAKLEAAMREILSIVPNHALAHKDLKKALEQQALQASNQGGAP